MTLAELDQAEHDLRQAERRLQQARYAATALTNPNAIAISLQGPVAEVNAAAAHCMAAAARCMVTTDHSEPPA